MARSIGVTWVLSIHGFDDLGSLQAMKSRVRLLITYMEGTLVSGDDIGNRWFILIDGSEVIREYRREEFEFL